MSDPVMFILSDARVMWEDLRVMNAVSAAINARPWQPSSTTLPQPLWAALHERGIDVEFPRQDAA